MSTRPSALTTALWGAAALIAVGTALCGLTGLVAGLTFLSGDLPTAWQVEVAAKVNDEAARYGTAAAGVLATIGVVAAVPATRAWQTHRLASGGGNQRFVIRLQPTHSAATILYGSMAVVALAVGAGVVAHGYGLQPPIGPRVDPGAPFPWQALVVATVVLVLCCAEVIVNGRRWATSRAVNRVLRDPSLRRFVPQLEQVSRAPSGRQPPHLDVARVATRRFQRPRLQAVDVRRNVIGMRPMSIAYLRLFENEPRARTFVKGAWREFGYVHLLRSAASVAPGEFKKAKASGNLRSLFVNHPDELRAKVHEARRTPPTRGFSAIRTVAGSTVWVHDRRGAYPMVAMLCHGDFWRHAVDILLDEADLVVLDLSGLTPRNVGVEYEVQRVIDRCPIGKVLFLTDPRGNMKFLMHHLQQAWRQMDGRSPNMGTVPNATAWIAVTDRYRANQTQQGQTVVKLVARRSQTRRILAAWQEQHLRSELG